ncbi:porin [Pantoea sp. 18069]|uniref:porin n=1 Tax=Pantoea sp. 18069 TaxID=2681415 RepID=UPI0013575962|nr:porin [Pantoea sp. 18069]
MTRIIEKRKFPIALLASAAALGAASSASAQSSVTVFGVVDAAVSHFSNTSRDPRGPTPADPLYQNRGEIRTSTSMLRHSGTTTSRLGFRGTEDLGGGLAASFWLEAPVTNDDGNAAGLTFVRRSTVSLSGPFGEIRLGRDYTPTFWNDSTFDPWAQIGAGAALGLAAGNSSPGNGFAANGNYARSSNSVGYFLPPKLGGIYGQAMYSFHESAVATSRAGRYVGGRLGYANGPLNIAVAYAESSLPEGAFVGTVDQARIFNLGGAYNFGVATLSAAVSRTKYERDYGNTPVAGRAPEVDMTGYLLAVTAPVGSHLIRAAYSRVDYDRHGAAGKPRTSKLAVGYVHNLSKRTALYATAARVNNRNGASLVVNGAPAIANNATYTARSSTGYDFGLRHSF